jgi:uncharacterized cupredoxin-like copper-binding protein
MLAQDLEEGLSVTVRYAGPRGRRATLRKLWPLLCLLMLVATAACSGDKSTKVSVTLSEWTVGPSISQMTAGKVTFEVTNNGSQEHGFTLIKNDLPPEMLPVANGSIALGQVNVVRTLPPIPPGKSDRVTIDLTPGKYVLVSNLGSDYQQGMTAEFLVEP